MNKKIVSAKIFVTLFKKIIKTLLILVFYLLQEVKSLQGWEYYSSETKEVVIPLCWPSRFVPYIFKGKFSTGEKDVI